jgi:hypothetical protein
MLVVKRAERQFLYLFFALHLPNVAFTARHGIVWTGHKKIGSKNRAVEKQLQQRSTIKTIV